MSCPDIPFPLDLIILRAFMFHRNMSGSHYLLAAFRSVQINVSKCLFFHPVTSLSDKEKCSLKGSLLYLPVFQLFALLPITYDMIFVLKRTIFSYLKMQTQDHFWSRTHSEVVYFAFVSKEA